LLVPARRVLVYRVRIRRALIRRHALHITLYHLALGRFSSAHQAFTRTIFLAGNASAGAAVPYATSCTIREQVSMRLNQFAASVTLAVTLTGAAVATGDAASAAESDAAMTTVIALAAQRLALAEPVARYKWVHGAKITDAPREKALLDDVAKRAAASRVDPAFARAFFADQIAASKTAQNAFFAGWHTTPPNALSDPIPDLSTSIRPRLDTLTRLLLVALAQVQPLRGAADCPARLAASLANWKLTAPGSATRLGALPEALAHVCASGGIGATG
jgi:chorismate mutase